MSTSQTTFALVEFMGGPFDGHRQVVSLPPQELDEVALLPVGKVLALLYEDPAYQELTSIAVYELADTSCANPSYRYLGVVANCTS